VLFRNTMAQSAGFALGYLFSFLLAPLMIARLGLDAFGVWAVTGAFVTYAGLLDLGVGRSLARFIAVFDAEGDERGMRECIGLGLLVIVSSGILAAIAAELAAPLLSDKLGVVDGHQMGVILTASVAIWVCNSVSGVLNAVAIGKQEMVPPNVATAIGATINFVFSVAVLLASTSLTAYAGANAAAALLAIVPSVVVLRRVWGGPYLLLPSRARAKEILGFGLKNQLSYLADLVNFQTDKVVIALMLDIHAAAVYEIGSRIVIAVRSLGVMSVSAMIPNAAARMVSEGSAVIEQVYDRYLTRTCSTAFPLFMLAAVTSPFLLVAWLGSVPGDAGVIVPILSVAYMVNITTGVGTTLAIGYGIPGVAASNAVAIAVANVALTVVLAPLFGIWGVVSGTALAVVLGSIAFNLRFLRLFHLHVRRFLDAVVPVAVLAVGLAVPPGLLALVVGLPSGRAPAIVLLALATTMYVLPYWLLASRAELLPRRLAFPGQGTPG
jgi:O-antigen/teichoic acid export membrane protein